MGAFESLTPQQLLEAVKISSTNSKNNDALELEELEDLYYNFLKEDKAGCLNFEHLSAKLFVSEMKDEVSGQFIFSERVCHYALADIGIKAIKQPDHPIWTDYGMDLVELGTYTAEILSSHIRAYALAGRSFHSRTYVARCCSPYPSSKIGILTESEPRTKSGILKWENRFDSKNSQHYFGPKFTSPQFGVYLFQWWIQHCRMCRGDIRLVGQITKLFHSERLQIEAWIFIKSYIEVVHTSVRDSKPSQGGLRQVATEAMIPDNLQNKSAVRISPLLFMIALNISPFTQDDGHQLALLQCCDKDDIALPNFNRHTSFHLACILQNADIVTDILKFQKATQSSCLTLLKARDRWGRIPMHYVCTIDMFKILLASEMGDTRANSTNGGPFKSICLSTANESGTTPCAWMISIVSDDGLECVLKQYLPESRGALNDAFVQAIRKNKEKAAYVLHRAGADVNGVSGEHDNPLRNAAEHGSMRVLKYLIDHGARIEGKSHYNHVIFDAIHAGHTDIVRYLVKRGVSIDVEDYLGHTPLQVAASVGVIETVQCLISEGADINAGRSKANTALIVAIRRTNLPMIKLLGQ
ncbi:ankyrin repeat-containing domain protein [Nemania sp. FL0916]|nr:ankyrin repeat-containing domain protein [Nemania sp. FL0916]